MACRREDASLLAARGSRGFYQAADKIASVSVHTSIGSSVVGYWDKKTRLVMRVVRAD